MKITTTVSACLLASFCVQGQNLILNGDFAAGNTNFTSDYSYSPGNMNPQGVYCVTNSPYLVSGRVWGSFGDNTSGNGLMLLGNGDSTATNAVWRQSVTVATDTSYLFSAWAANAYPANPASFYFFVNGVPRGNPVALPADTTGVWQNYSVVWNSESNATALLEIRMLNTAFFGNDFVLDDLSFRRLASPTSPPLSIQTAAQVSWPSVANQLYQVQWADVLGSNQWFSFGPPVVGNGTTNVIFDPMGNNSQRFYRVLPIN